jgi:nucleotide-binding universal stress UspA family protein
MAVRLARARGTAVHVLHVVEHDVVAGEAEVAAERDDEATQTLRACTEVLAQAGVTVSGELLHTHGDHADVGRAILRRAAALSAGLIVVGPATRHGALASVLGPSVTAHIAAHAPCHVLIVNPRAGAVGAGAGSVAPALWDPVR